MSRFARNTAKFAGSTVCGRVVAGVDVEKTVGEPARLAGHPCADPQRDGANVVEADAAAEEQIRRIAGSRRQAGAGAPGEGEHAEILEEEIALLGKEQVEPRQVDLLLVDFHLREVGVEGEVRGEVLGDAVSEIAAGAARHVVRERLGKRAIGRDAAEHVRLHLHVPRAGRDTKPHQRSSRRDLQDAAEGRERARHLRQVRPLVLPPDDAPQVDAPGLLRLGLIAKRLERDRDLDRPALIEDGGLHVPHGVPVGVRRAFVGDLAVGEAADRVRVEEVAVPPVVEGVEQHGERVVLAELAGVAPHLVRHAPVRAGSPSTAPRRRCSCRRRTPTLRCARSPARPSSGSCWTKSPIGSTASGRSPRRAGRRRGGRRAA